MTRSPRGARFACWAVIGALVVAIPAVGARRDEGDEGPGPLPWRVGGPLGFTVDAAAFPDSGGNVLEVYTRIPPATLATRVGAGSEAQRLSVSARLRNRFGAKQHEASQEFQVVAEDTASFGKVVLLRFPARPGRYRLQVRVEDPRSRKRGLAYVGRTVREKASVEGEVVVPQAQAGREISDLEFAWAETPAEQAGSFRRTSTPGESVGVLPNPERLYGLLAGDLRAVFVARSSSPAPRPWRWAARIMDASGKVVAERESTGAAGRSLTQAVRFDVSTQPAGGYDLEVKAWQEGDAGALSRRAHFGIAWQPSSWNTDPVEVEDLMHFLLDSGDEEESFARMNAGEQERFLDEYWRQRDPTPDTAENEARTAFLARIDHANRTWGRAGLGKGMFSDMGRVYIRHGEPDEILRQVIPAGDQTLTQVLQELEVSQDRPTGSVNSKGPGGDQRPFEIWIYEGRDELVGSAPIVAGPRPARRLLFLFVDDQGYGDFRLRYSTE